MGDIGRCELVEGTIVRISPVKPSHGRFEFRLGKRISDFVEANALGEVMVGEVGVFVRRVPDTVRGADILSPTDVQEFAAGDTLVADDILPGFSLPLGEIF